MSAQPLLGRKRKEGPFMLHYETGISEGHMHAFLSKSVSGTKKVVFVRVCGDALLLLMGGIYARLHFPFIPPMSQHPPSSFVVASPSETSTGLTRKAGRHGTKVQTKRRNGWTEVDELDENECEKKWDAPNEPAGRSGGAVAAAGVSISRSLRQW